MLSQLAFFPMPGGWELIIILVVALLIFGTRLPKIMRGMGSSVREFKEGMDGTGTDAKKVASTTDERTP